ncbi:MAG: glutamine-hydrolyzing GMP synthase [Planctomycetota bacterium]|jgi:GMP synthase (glutamine-hydrolysing)
MPHNEVVPVLDFGSQTAQLIARRVRDAGAFSILVRPDIPLEEIRALNPKGIILSGGPSSVYDEGSPTCDPRILEMGVPVLGICYGMQLACQMLGCTIERGVSREFGRANLHITDREDLFTAIPERTAVWMSHADQVIDAHHSLIPLASTDSCPFAAVRHKSLPFLGVQFHPEVTHTPHGIDILQNFLYETCRCQGTWKMSEFLQSEIARLRETIGDRRVICGLSGGVDSSVCAALLQKAIGSQLSCVFVDNGLLRKNERELVERTFVDHFQTDLHVVDAGDLFLQNLAGVTDPQEKRRVIGHTFIDVFKEESTSLDDATILAQGTLYPDVIESGESLAGTASGIKLHHNVGGLPAELGLDLVEPLRDLFKDEVRRLGEVLGLPEKIVWRHPFPGPGLAVRVIGEITKEKLDLLREADEILIEEIVAANLYRATSQVFAVLLPIQSVGVMGDGRSYEQVCAIRAVETQDFMTADWARIPFDVLATISNRIINEVQGLNRVVYDISSKPPATIEWE